MWYNRCRRPLVIKKSSSYYYFGAIARSRVIKKSSSYYYFGAAAPRGRKSQEKILNANENHSHLAGIKKARPREGAGNPERNACSGGVIYASRSGGLSWGCDLPLKVAGSNPRIFVRGISPNAFLFASLSSKKIIS